MIINLKNKIVSRLLNSRKMPSNADKVVIFHHTIKTGGTSLNNWFKTFYEDKAFNVLHLDDANENELDKALKEYENRNRTYGKVK